MRPSTAFPLPLRLALLPMILLLGCSSAVDDDDTGATGDDDDFSWDDDDDTGVDDDDTGVDDDDTGVDDDDTGVDDDDTGADDDDTGVDDDDTGADDDDDDTVPGDGDGDGYASTAAGGEDCDDGDAQIFPGQVEDPGNSLDDDCDGDIDEPLSVTGISPDSGLMIGGGLISLTGSGLWGVTAITVGGTPGTGLWVLDDGEVQVSTPPGVPGDVDVVVSNVYGSDTLVGGYRYTGTSTSLTTCALLGPAEQTTSPGVPTSVDFTATLTEPGVTDSAGAPAGILAEVGYGGQGSTPDIWPDWWWASASWSADSSPSDTFAAPISPHSYGTYQVSFRFSADGGLNWLYCDMTPQVPGLSASDLAVLNSVP